MKYLVFAMGGVFVLDLFMVMTTAYTTHINLISYMTLDITMVLQGQVWRLLTWLIVPNQDNMLWMALSLYFYYFIGTALESRWGARRFLIFFVIGAIANIAAAFLSHAITGYGYGVNTYLYFSLFLAFAALYPDMQFMLFFVLPIKAKWLAAVDLVYFLMAIVMGGVSLRMAAIASLVNILPFFGEDIWQTGRRMYFQWQRRRQFRR